MVYPERKVRLLNAFCEAFKRFDQVIIIDLMNISTEQIVKTRLHLRKENGIILIGKNTISSLAIKILTSDDDPKASYYELQKKHGKKPDLEKLLPFIKGKIGFVFCDKSYIEMKPVIEKETIKMPAKSGIIAPCDVWLPAGPTFLDPGKIGEFQRLGIQTKTVKSALEITKDYKLCSKGEIVSETVSSMCRLLSIIPFEYSMKLIYVMFNKQILDEKVISITPQQICDFIGSASKLAAAVSLEAGIPNALSVPHIIQNTFKTVLAVGLEANIKMAILDSLASKSAAPAATAAPAASKKVEEKKEEVVEEVDVGFDSLFG